MDPSSPLINLFSHDFWCSCVRVRVRVCGSMRKQAIRCGSIESVGGCAHACAHINHVRLYRRLLCVLCARGKPMKDTTSHKSFRPLWFRAQGSGLRAQGLGLGFNDIYEYDQYNICLYNIHNHQIMHKHNPIKQHTHTKCRGVSLKARAWCLSPKP